MKHHLEITIKLNTSRQFSKDNNNKIIKSILMVRQSAKTRPLSSLITVVSLKTTSLLIQTATYCQFHQHLSAAFLYTVCKGFWPS